MVTKADQEIKFRGLSCVIFDKKPTDKDVFEQLEKSNAKRGHEITISYGLQKLNKKSSSNNGSSFTEVDSHRLGNKANNNVIVGKCRFNVDYNDLKKASCLISLGSCFL